ncbi:hypothetical protein QBC34DRAFT_332802 [Podospora aff. communis PSN243]|uniref:Uncharacterized protein n=1 Tax=Podospora aff. communis PSN243 TaxID=3040156 RepID=A0AAV9GF16_9PEZI|nr:hypothetical protein QBC34DRAFT_332802 [Podospora aff. communis PSN243]
MSPDVPNYKAVPLRTSFLALLFLFVCSLLGTLEYLIRTVPTGQDRNGIPQEAEFVPARKRAAMAPEPLPEPMPDPSPEPAPDPRLSSDQYANFGSITTYITRVDSWYGNPQEPYLRTPLFPGDDTSGKCIFRYSGIVVTDDKSGCLAVLGRPPNRVVPPGLSYASAWLYDEISFPTGGPCDGNLENWYSWDRSPSPPPQYSLFTPELDHLREDLYACQWNDTGRQETYVPMYPIQPPGPGPKAIVMLYKGRFWMSAVPKDFSPMTAPPNRRDAQVWEAGWPHEVLATITIIRFLPSMFYGYSVQMGFRRAPMPTPSPSLQTLDPVSQTSTVDAITSQAATTSHQGSIPTPAPAGTPPPIPSPSSLPGISSTSLQPADVSNFELPVEQVIVTTTQFTGPNGILTTSPVTSILTTTVLVQIPQAMIPASFSTQTDASGRPTNTVTNFNGHPILITTQSTLYDPENGAATATLVITAPPTTEVITSIDRWTNKTTTLTRFPGFPQLPGARPADITPTTRVSYFVVYFLPLLLTIFLLAPIQAVDAEIKQILPYRSLLYHANTSRGCSGCGLTIPTTGLFSHWAGIHLLFCHRDALSILSDLLLLCGTVLVALSPEMIGLKLRGTCLRWNTRSCVVTVAVFEEPVRAAEGILAGMSVMILAVAYILEKGRTGLATRPGSVAGVCALLQVDGAAETLKGLGRAERGDGWDVKRVRARLGWSKKGKRGDGYGILVERKSGELQQRPGAGKIIRIPDGRSKKALAGGLGVSLGKRVFQGVFLACLCGLLGVVLYYELTEYGSPDESAFEWFMDSEEFGVGFLFACLGQAVSFAWDYLCGDMDDVAIYLRMAQRPQPAGFSVLDTRPTNLFESLWRAIRWRDPLVGSVAFAGVLSKFLPALLSSVPYASAQTWKTHEICTWSTVGLLILMIIILIGHIIFAKWPYLPVPPSSLAGVIYYVCDSQILKDFERLSTLSKPERDRRVVRTARMYRFGWMAGASGKRRVGIDYAEGEQGYQMHSLAAFGFGIAGNMRPR